MTSLGVDSAGQAADFSVSWWDSVFVTTLVYPGLYSIENSNLRSLLAYW
jgi:hypothetical protein